MSKNHNYHCTCGSPWHSLGVEGNMNEIAVQVTYHPTQFGWRERLRAAKDVLFNKNQHIFSDVFLAPEDAQRVASDINLLLQIGED
jgi:hypothetical protein